MTLPFNLPIGRIVLHNGQRLRFEGDLGNSTLRFSDVRTGGIFQVTDTSTLALVLPTVDWVLREHAAGRFVDPMGDRQSRNGRQAEFAGMDTEACRARDPKAAMRFRWTWAVFKAGTPRTDRAYGEFIARRASDLEREDRLPPPTASSLRRWFRDFEAGGGRMFSLVSLAGRLDGCSQLCAIDDNLVQNAAVYYWAERRANIRDAEAYMLAQRSKIIEAGTENLPEKPPSYEAVRLRVRRLETYSSYKAKFGKTRADKKFGAVGESIEATFFGERVYGDGTETKQITVFDADWSLPGGKMKVVAFIDGWSLFVFPPAVFAGPYRSETSIQALINVMTPPEVEDEILAENPLLAAVRVTPVTIIPDNATNLIGPGYVPALNELGSDLELPGVYDHDAKSPIEGFWGALKEFLDGLPGTVLGPRQPKDLAYDPVAGAEITREQQKAMVQAFIHRWNTTPKTCLGDRSPLDLVQEHMLANDGGERLTDPGHIRRTLGRTVEGRILTTNGVEYDGIRYRGDAVEELLADNYHATPIGERVATSAKCIVPIRVFDGDLDTIQVWNAKTKVFVELYSTQPGYTGMLTRWEHHALQAMARARREKFKTEEQRVRSRIRSLREIDENAHKLPYRRRDAMMTLYECDQIRRLSGKRASSPGFQRDLPNEFFPMTTATSLRRDMPKAPPGPTNTRKQKPAAAPKRPEGYYSTGGLTVPPTGTRDSIEFDWAQVGEEADDDEIDTQLPEDEQ